MIYYTDVTIVKPALLQEYAVSSRGVTTFFSNLPDALREASRLRDQIIKEKEDAIRSQG